MRNSQVCVEIKHEGCGVSEVMEELPPPLGNLDCSCKPVLGSWLHVSDSKCIEILDMIETNGTKLPADLAA